jgi:hypothetical protein
MGAAGSNRRSNGLRGRVLLGLAAVVAMAAAQLSGCSVSGMDGTKAAAEKVPALDVGIPAVTEIVAGPREAVPPATPAATPPTAEHPATKVAAETNDGQQAQTPTAPAGPLEVVCPDAATAKARFFFSPARPRPGKPLRITAVAEEELPAAGIELVQAEGRVPLPGLSAWGGPPSSWSVTIDAAMAGVQQVLLASGDPSRPYACAEVNVATTRSGDEEPPISTGAWSIRREWNREMEDLYAAWIGRLFLVDPGAKAGWRPLHQVLRDPKRNILYGYLGLNEDDAKAKVKVILTPDCADTPFFLRAYFSWKLQLPFAMRKCLRGDAINGPQCNADPITNLTPEWDDVNSVVERFNRFVGLTVANTVHSGTVRTVPEDDTSDLYPVALSQQAIRPGTVFADPNGHVLVVTRWLAGTADRMGMLLAIDAHPDLTVSHKRFSPANFYFAANLRTGGFKAFRPAVYEHGAVRLMTNAELAADPDYANRSLDQYAFTESADFYRTVDKLLNPIPLDPVKAYRSRMEALIELLEERVSAVQVGLDYQYASRWAEIEMPEGGAIFETTGPWEDYSTPARDLRLLLAIDELLAFPRYVQDNPDIFRIPAGKTMAQVRSDLDAEWARSGAELSISYKRSDRSTWTLTLAQIIERATKFEESYNPNDCSEVRWGATPGSDEFSPCTRRAPYNQRKMMESYRIWHAERRRPAGF